MEKYPVVRINEKINSILEKLAKIEGLPKSKLFACMLIEYCEALPEEIKKEIGFNFE